MAQGTCIYYESLKWLTFRFHCFRKRQRIKAGKCKEGQILGYSLTYSTNICQFLAWILDRWGCSLLPHWCVWSVCPHLR